MIEHDEQLAATLERICYFAKIQAGIRQTATPTQFASMSVGYLSELNKLFQQVIEYLKRQDVNGTVSASTTLDQTQVIV